MDKWMVRGPLDSAKFSLPIPIKLRHIHNLLHEPFSRPLAVKLSVKVGAVAWIKCLVTHETKAFPRPRSRPVVKTNGREQVSEP